MTMQPPTEKQIQQQEANKLLLTELLDTEKSYVEQLKKLVKFHKWFSSQEFGRFIPLGDVDFIFSSIDKIYTRHQGFYDRLEETIQKSLDNFNLKPFVGSEKELIGHVFDEFDQEFIDHYITYLGNVSKATNTLKKYRVQGGSGSDSFDAYLKTLEDIEEEKLEDLLIMPVQRISRYTLFIADLLEMTEPESTDYNSLHGALEKFEEIGKNENSSETQIQHVQVQGASTDKRAHLLAELLVTEKNYIEQLKKLVKFHKWFSSTEFRRFIPLWDVDVIFCSIDEIYERHQSFYNKLEQAVVIDRRHSVSQQSVDNYKPDEQREFESVGLVFDEFDQDFIDHYISFLGNVTKATNTLKKYRTESGNGSDSFHVYLETLEQLEKEQLKDLLVMPFQRIPRYSLLITDLLKVTEPGSTDSDSLNDALEIFKKIGTSGNSEAEKGQSDEIYNELRRKMKDLKYGHKDLAANEQIKLMVPVLGYEPYAKKMWTKNNILNLYVFQTSAMVARMSPSFLFGDKMSDPTSVKEAMLQFEFGKRYSISHGINAIRDLSIKQKRIEKMSHCLKTMRTKLNVKDIPKTAIENVVDSSIILSVWEDHIDSEEEEDPFEDIILFLKLQDKQSFLNIMQSLKQPINNTSQNMIDC